MLIVTPTKDRRPFKSCLTISANVNMSHKMGSFICILVNLLCVFPEPLVDASSSLTDIGLTTRERNGINHADGTRDVGHTVSDLAPSSAHTAGAGA